MLPFIIAGAGIGYIAHKIFEANKPKAVETVVETIVNEAIDAILPPDDKITITQNENENAKKPKTSKKSKAIA